MLVHVWFLNLEFKMWLLHLIYGVLIHGCCDMVIPLTAALLTVSAQVGRRGEVGGGQHAGLFIDSIRLSSLTQAHMKEMMRKRQVFRVRDQG